MNLKKAHPITSLLYFTSLGVVMMLTEDPVMRIISLVSMCMYSFLLFGARIGFSDLCFYIPMLAMVSLINPMFSHNGATPLFFLNGNPVTLEAVICGVFIGVSVVAVLYLCKCLSEIMTGDKILYLLGNITPKLALMLSMTMRFIPLFKERYRKASDAQKTLGIYSSDSRTDRIKCAFSVFSAVVSQSIERSVETSSSMKSRGYGIGKRSCYSLFRFTPYDGALIAIVSLCTALIALLSLAGVLDFGFYPRMTSISPNALRVLAYAIYALLAFIPSLLEIKENFKWKYLISRI